MLRRDLRKAALSGRRTMLVLAAATAGAAMVSPNWAQADSYTWGSFASGTTPLDGAGTWNTTLTNWFAGGNTPIGWTNGSNDTPVFGAGGTGGSINIPTTVTATGLTINAAGYTLGTGAGGSGSIILENSAIVAVNANATINAQLIGNSPDFVISPTSTLSLPTGTSPFGFTSGWTMDGGGTISISGSAATTGGPVTLNSGTIVINGTSAGVNGTLTVGNAGTTALIESNNGTFTGNILSATPNTGVLYLASTTASANVYTLSGSGQDLSQFTGTFKIGLGNGTINGGTGVGTATSLRWNAPSAAVGNETGVNAVWDLQGNGLMNTRTLGVNTTGTIELGGLAGSGSAILDSTPTNNSNVIYEIGGANVDTTYSGLIRNNGAVVNRTTGISKIGTGKLTLSGTNTYTGVTQVNGGTLAITLAGAISTSPSIAVNHQAFNNITGLSGTGTFDVSALGTAGYTIPNAQTITGNGGNIFGTINVANATGLVNPGTNPSGAVSAGTLNFHDTLNMNGGTLAFDLSNNAGSGNDFLNIGSLEVSAPSRIVISPLAAYASSGSTYTLIDYTGSNQTTAQLLSDFTLASTTNGTFHLDTSTVGQIKVVIDSVLPPSNLHWTIPAAASGTLPWDVGVSKNFTSAPGDNPPSTVVSFHQGDNVVLDDTVGVQTSISFSGSVTPSSLHFTNSINNYVFSGNGVGTIAGPTSIIKDGTASVSFSNANAFVGGTTINSGTLRVSNALGLGDPNTAGQVDLNGGTLGVDGAITFPLPINISASGSTISDVGNATLSNQVEATNMLVNIDLPGTALLSLLPAVFQNSSPSSGLSGTLSVDATSGGTLRIQGGNVQDQYEFIDLGQGSANMTLRDSGAVQFAGLSGGPLTAVHGVSSATNAGTVVLGGTDDGTDPGADAPTGTSTFAGSIQNGLDSATPTVLNISKNNSFWTLVLTGTNSYTGQTIVNQGTLLLNGSHFGGNTYSVVSGATFGGSGQMSGTVDLLGSLVPGGSGTTGALTVGTLLVDGGSVSLDVGGGKSDRLNITGAGTNSNGFVFFGSSQSVNLKIAEIGSTGTYGRYDLIDYNAGASGGTLSNLGSFVANGGGAITIHGVSSTLVNNTLNTSIDLYVPNPSENDSSWVGTTNNQWQTGVTGNWANAVVPANADDVAIFTDTNAGTVALANPETVAFVNINTSTGTYNISGSTLTLDASGGYVGVNVLQNGDQTISAPVVIGKSAIFAVNDTASLTVSGNISDNEGAGSLTSGLSKSGNGTLTLSGVNTYSGPTTLNGGEVVINSNSSLGDDSATNTLVLAGGTLKTIAPVTSAVGRPVVMLGSSTIDTGGNAVEIDGSVTGVGTLAITSSTTPGTFDLTAANGFTGAVRVDSGTLMVTSSSNLGDSSGTNRLVLNGGAVVMEGGYTSGRNMILSQTGTIDTNGNSGTFSGNITGTGGLVKQGTGTLSLTGTNPFTGLVSVIGGALDAPADASLGGGNGTATVGSSSTTSTTVTLGTIPNGLGISSSFLGSTVLSITGTTGNFTVTLAAPASLNLSNGPASFATALPITLDGGSLVQFGTYSFSESNTVTGVPALNASMNRNFVMGVNGGTISSSSTGTGTIAGVISGPGTFSKGGSGTLLLSGTNTYSGATVVNSGTLILSGPGTWATTALAATQTATNGSVVNAGRLLYSYGATTANDPVATVKTALAAGYSQSPRFSTSLIRTTNAIDNLHGIGWVDNGTSAVTVAYTYYGDADLSGTVNVTDFNAVALNYGSATGTWAKGDFNYDGNVNLLDLNAVATNFGATPALDLLPSSIPLDGLISAPVPLALGALVPEPASLGLIAVGAGMMLRRRRR